MMRRFFTTVLICLCANISFTQSAKLTSVIKNIEKETGIIISYDADLIKHHTCTFDPSGKSLEQIINELNSITGFEFKLIDSKNVILKKGPLQLFSQCIRIKDASNDQFLPGATAVVLDQPKVGGVSNSNGEICLKGELFQSDVILIKALGYQNFKIPLVEINKGDFEINLVVEEQQAESISLDIFLTTGIAINPQTHGIEIEIDDLALLPGETSGDVLQSIQVLPGITSANGKSGTINIRGSSTDQTLILLDDVPIYHKGHFYGTLSPFNPDAVGSINVYRSGFHPKYGGRVGGTIDVRTKSNVPDTSSYGVGMNMLFGSGFANTKLDKNQKVGLVLGFRSFLPTSWQTPRYKAVNNLAQQLSRYSAANEDDNVNLVDQNIRVYDINGKINVVPDSTQSVSLSFFKIFNRDRQDFITGSDHELRGIVELNNIGSSLIWEKKLSPLSNLSVSGIVSDYSFRLYNNRLNASDVEVLRQDHLVKVQDLHSKVVYSTKLSDSSRSKIDVGYSYIWQQTISNIYDQFDPVNSFENYTSAKGIQNVVFGNYQYSIPKKLNVNIGNRFVHYNRTNRLGVEPRVNLSYFLNSNISLKGSSGYYQQYLSQLVYFDLNDIRVENHQWDLASDTRPTVNNLQSMLGFTVNTKGWLFDVEMYTKTLHKLNVASGPPGSPTEYSKGSGKVYGADVLIRKRWDMFDVWASYTYTYNRWKFSVVSDEEFRPYFDQPHILNLVGAMNIKKWKFSLGWSYKSGLPNQEVSTGYVISPPSLPQPDPGVEYKGRYKNLHQLDLSILYEFKPSNSWRGNVGLSILNLYDQDNIIEEDYVRFDPGSPANLQYRSLVGFAPNLSLNIYW